MERIDELIAGKRRIFLYYAEGMKNLPVQMNPEPQGTVNGYWMPTVVINEDVRFDRDAVLKVFRAKEIDGRVFFWPLSMLPMFHLQPANQVSYGLYERAMNLPSYHDLTYEDQDRVLDVMLEMVGRFRI
jgi:perosamine synthetase